MISVIIPVYSLTDEMNDMADNAFQSAWMTLDYDAVPHSIEFIAVDDGSPVPFKNPVGETITLKENSGYTVAVNNGLEAAQGDILVVGNSDLTFLHGWLTGLVRTLDTYDIATLPTTDQTWETRDEITENEKFGALFAMKRETYEKLGPLDIRFRGYFVDTAYRRRALDMGLTIGKNWNYLVEHQAKATYSKVDGADDEYQQAKEIYTNIFGGLE